MRVAEAGHLDTVQALIAKGADLNLQEMHGYTSLMWAVMTGNAAIARVLLEHGANADLRENKKAWTALMMAAVKGDAAMVRLLLDKGADVKATDADGFTALTAAKKHGDLATIAVLQEAGAQG